MTIDEHWWAFPAGWRPNPKSFSCLSACITISREWVLNMTLLIAGARFCIRKRISPGQIHCAPHPHLRVWYPSVTQIWPAGLQLSCRVAEKMGLTDGNWLNNSSRIDQPRPAAMRQRHKPHRRWLPGRAVGWWGYDQRVILSDINKAPLARLHWAFSVRRYRTIWGSRYQDYPSAFAKKNSAHPQPILSRKNSRHLGEPALQSPRLFTLIPESTGFLRSFELVSIT